MVFDSNSGLVLTERILGKGRTRTWPLADLGSCSVKGGSFQTKGANDKELVLEAGAGSLRIGKALSERELRALSDAINSWRRED
jgi:hypothetical protein